MLTRHLDLKCVNGTILKKNYYLEISKIKQLRKFFKLNTKNLNVNFIIIFIFIITLKDSPKVCL